ncbi:hypothetical protein SAMN06265795_11018 [Noviherbaspirillum humi]|uniref:Uncharacterized protein n=2 Tax=Noviherbaspirillum humi TaxID=1688639 RepID=A0A239ILS4_9BURK|nr:hypothetical protein SAMN06265795_11018 [Noviherbaspirillum humi]
MHSKFAVPVALVVSLLASMPALAAGWSLPPDRGTLEPEAIAAIRNGNEYPETSGYRKQIDYIDFTAYGQSFTQVVVTLVPDNPRRHHGRKLVVAGGEPGSEYAMDFLETPEGKEGPGVWLAKRGVTFIALTRVGRWNFLARDGSGSWQDIPLEQRMPIFNRRQAAPWSAADFEVKTTAGKEATSGDSSTYRMPKADTQLYRQMLATTAQTYLAGYRKAIEHALPPAQRDQALLLYWGMSTGGAFLYPLAKHLPPDGYLGWGTSSTGLAYVYRKSKAGDYATPYAQTALRLRERGYDDFTYYTRELDEATRQRWWQNALKSPRFKSGEDAPMQFNAAALTETALRLWQADWLPAEYRQRGLPALLQEVMEPSLPPAALKTIPVLDMNGTRDEAIPPKVVDAHREVMEPQVAKYRVARVRDFSHYLYTQDSIKVVGNLWLRFIESGYFDK